MGESFSLDGWDDVTVKLPPGLSRESFLDFPPYKTWIATLKTSIKRQKYGDHVFHEEPYKLKEIDVQSFDEVTLKSGQKRILFLKLVALVENDKGESVPGVAFLRGGAVAVLMVLRPYDSLDERYVIMTEQPRIPAGSLNFMEIPAGMLDPGDGSFSGAAAREIDEEIGLKLNRNELIDMTELALKGHQTEETLQNAMYPSPGGCDEYISIFLWEKEMDRMQIDGLRGRLTGDRTERENIKVSILNYERLLHVGARDGKTLAAWSLYEYLKRTREIP
jgi:ADP-sugar diphosphatase